METFIINDRKVYLELNWLAKENEERVHFLVKNYADPVTVVFFCVCVWFFFVLFYALKLA